MTTNTIEKNFFLTPHFSLKEMTASATATQLRITNCPNATKKQTRGNCFSLVFRCMSPYFSLFLLRLFTQWCSFLHANTTTTKPMICAKFAT